MGCTISTDGSDPPSKKNKISDMKCDKPLNKYDLIRIEISGAQGDTLSEKIDKKMSGNYLIAELCHYINIKEGGYTKLTLVRDSIGKRPSRITL